MGNGIYTALAGAVATGDALDVTANNVANATTTGFRAERVAFREIVTRATGDSMRQVSAASGMSDDRAGVLRQTGGALDLAIQGDAYFAVDTPRGVRYTRAGAFQLDGEGRLVTPDGLAVRGAGGPIVVPPEATAIAVGGDGTVEVDGVELGRLELVTFPDGALRREGDTLFSAAAGAARPAGDDVVVTSGALEAANFDLVRGVVDLVKVSRTYEALHRMIERYRDIDSRTARDLGAP